MGHVLATLPMQQSMTTMAAIDTPRSDRITPLYQRGSP